jgi:ribonuclease HI
VLFEPDFVVNIDGASRGNPGEASYGFVIQDRTGKVLHKGSDTIGKTTNNVAEYTALIRALEFALKRNIRSLEIRSDSLLLVNQMRGEFKIRSAPLAELAEECRKLLAKLDWFEIRHVPREENKLADRLANQALNKQKKMKNEK